MKRLKNMEKITIKQKYLTDTNLILDGLKESGD